MSDVPTLEELAQQYERERVKLEELDAEAGRLKGPYHKAIGRASAQRKRVDMLKLVIESGKRSYMVTLAMQEVGIETDAPPMIVVPGDVQDPRPYFLAALSADGVGLYKHRPKHHHRYQGTEYAIERKHLPQELAPAFPTRDRWSLRDAETIFQEAGYSRSAGAESRPIYKFDGLVGWMERGKGDFGDGSGSIKPLKPPTGGRWRWLKIREQEVLPA